MNIVLQLLLRYNIGHFGTVWATVSKRPSIYLLDSLPHEIINNFKQLGTLDSFSMGIKPPFYRVCLYSSVGVTRSHRATPDLWYSGSLEMVHFWFIRDGEQLSLNSFFDLSSPFFFNLTQLSPSLLNSPNFFFVPKMADGVSKGCAPRVI